MGAFFVRALTVTVPAHSCVRNRKSESCRFSDRRDRVVSDIFSKSKAIMKIVDPLTELPGGALIMKMASFYWSFHILTKILS